MYEIIEALQLMIAKGICEDAKFHWDNGCKVVFEWLVDGKWIYGDCEVSGSVVMITTKFRPALWSKNLMLNSLDFELHIWDFPELEA